MGYFGWGHGHWVFLWIEAYGGTGVSQLLTALHSVHTIWAPRSSKTEASLVWEASLIPTNSNLYQLTPRAPKYEHSYNCTDTVKSWLCCFVLFFFSIGCLLLLLCCLMMTISYVMNPFSGVNKSLSQLSSNFNAWKKLSIKLFKESLIQPYWSRECPFRACAHSRSKDSRNLWVFKIITF